MIKFFYILMTLSFVGTSVYAEDSQVSSNTDNIVKLHIQMDKLARDNQSLMGRLETLFKTNSELKKELERLSALIGHYHQNASADDAQSLAEQNSKEAVAEASKKSNTLYDDAKTALSTLNYAKAVKLFEQYIASYPQGDKVNQSYYWLARSLLLSSQYDEAIVNYQRFITASPDDKKLTKGYYNMAQAYLALDNFKSAHEVFSLIIEKYPKSVDAIKAKKHLESERATKVKQ